MDERIDELDERHWGLDVPGGKATLHLEHYTGISLYVASHGLADDDSPSRALLDGAFGRLRGHDPAQAVDATYDQFVTPLPNDRPYVGLA